jgi:ABC-2 type transport system ATP-binding protein
MGGFLPSAKTFCRGIIMKPDNAIEVKDVTKKFRIYFDKGHTLKEKTLFRKRRTFEERSVLKGISFEVKKGEAVGLIGHNGCGKSTTLKLLTKIMYPDSGSIEMCGRVSSLLELGAGFHPDMSGRENIYINASIFGLAKKEIDERLEDVIAFSELEESIDHPVRTYSSGMYMRLAFSVAINVDADILLIDEILAVGDAGFQKKCFRRLKEIKEIGTTIVIVSHSMEQIEKNCDRSIWIHEGKIQAEGNPQEISVQYMDYMEEHRRAVAEREEKRKINRR